MPKVELICQFVQLTVGGGTTAKGWVESVGQIDEFGFTHPPHPYGGRGWIWVIALTGSQTGSVRELVYQYHHVINRQAGLDSHFGSVTGSKV